MSNNWQAIADKDGNAWCAGVSFCWLYCWAINGMCSTDTRDQSRAALNEIFGCYVQGGSFYNTFHSEANHEWARDQRMRLNDDLTVENGLAQRAPYLMIGSPFGESLRQILLDDQA
ncbi:MAG: hypothetical protein WCJ35_19400 [Planctomycetota bacterium]